jgi:hypothetical protein
MVAGRPITVQVGDVEVLAQTVPVPGTEPTSAVADRVLEAFDRAQEVIVEMARSTAAVIERAAARAARPDHVEIEFSLGFSVTGKVVMVAGATGEATLRVLLSYDAKPAPVAETPALASPGPPGAGTS